MVKRQLVVIEWSIQEITRLTTFTSRQTIGNYTMITKLKFSRVHTTS